MLFVLHAIDRPGGEQRRLKVYEGHRANFRTASEYGVRVVVAGPLMSPDGSTMIGSLEIMDAPDEASVRAFKQRDPFLTEVWESYTLHRFDQRGGTAALTAIDDKR